MPVVLFFEIIEGGDLKKLVLHGSYSEDELSETWEAILFEFETLTSSTDYRMQLRQMSDDVRRVNRINGLIALYYIALYGGEDISEDLMYWRVKGNDYNAARLEIMREQTKLNIEAIKKKKPASEKHSFVDLWTAVENGLDRNIDVENCSVKKWVSLCKSLEKKAKSYERQDKRK